MEFPEFVWGLSAWVGMDEADDTEEADLQSDVNLQSNASHEQTDIEAINKQLTQEQNNDINNNPTVASES